MAGVQGHVARLVVGQEKEEGAGQGAGQVVERSSSRVATKVSSLMKWPAKPAKEKDKATTAAHLYVSDTSQV